MIPPGVQIRPEWTVLGAQAGDGNVVVLASKSLQDAVLEAETHYIPDLRSWDVIRDVVTRYTITMGVRDFCIIVAPTYEQAFTNLFRTWNPEPGQPDERPALPHGPEAIES